MEKQNNVSAANSKLKGNSQRKPNRKKAGNANTADGLTNVLTIDVPKRDLSMIKNSARPRVINSNDKAKGASTVVNNGSKKENEGRTMPNAQKKTSNNTAQKKPVKPLKPNTNKKPKESDKPVANKKAKANNNPNAKQKTNTSKNTIVKQNTNTKLALKPNTNVKKNNQETKKTTSKRNQQIDPKKATVKIIPLGGLNEIGKNLTVIECSNDIIILDSGIAFPDSEMPGIDLVIPDYTYLEENKDKIRGIVITHGHEDHIGGLPFLLKKISAPVYATRLTIGLIEGKLKEHGLLGKVKLNTVTPKQTVKLGCMAAEFIRVNHSIPDAVGIAFHTPAGIICHTGDFKVDFTPIEGGAIDLARFAELGNKGVLALMSDSTNSERPGYTMSERLVGDSFEKLFQKADGKRIIIATFASNVHRVQQIIDRAEAQGRKVAVSGRSMVNVIGKGVELGYLKCPEGILVDIDKIKNYNPEQLVIITTGSQGEPMSALTRMSRNEHRQVGITSSDFIIISATPIPGNEKLVTNVVNELMKTGATVVYEAMYDVHVSGHACQEEQKLILSLTKPKFFIPVHGEYKHLYKHALTANNVGIPKKNIIIGNNGDVIETDGNVMKVTSSVKAGQVLVDGLGVGDVGAIVLRDRKLLAEDGLIILVATIDNFTHEVVSGPDVVSRGFVYVRESEELLEEARRLISKELDNCMLDHVSEWNIIKTRLKDILSTFIYTKTKRRPMILPIIMDV